MGITLIRPLARNSSFMPIMRHMNLAPAHNWLARFGRRKHLRYTVNLPARITTLEGWQTAELANLSASGAMIRIAPGTEKTGTLLLQWQGFSVFGLVVWSEIESVGVQFDKTIDDYVIKQTRLAAHLLASRRESLVRPEFATSEPV